MDIRFFQAEHQEVLSEECPEYVYLLVEFPVGDCSMVKAIEI